MAVIDLKAATVTITDGAAGSVEAVLGDGNVTFTETVNREYRLNRGVLNTVKDGDEEPMSVSFELEWEYLAGATPYAIVKNLGDTYTSSDTVDPCAPYACNIVIDYDPDCATGDSEVITFPDFRYENINGDLSGSQLSVDGRCNVTEPTSVRTPA